MKWYRIIIPLFAALLFSNCAVFQPARELEVTPAEKLNEVSVLLSSLKTKNDLLKNFKGIGNIRLKQNGSVQIDQRVVWSAQMPAKLSLAVLISGYPAIKLAADGQWLYYLESHGPKTKFKKIRSRDPSLRRIISIPISASDVIMLLAGRIPVSPFDSVVVIEEKATDGYVLLLKDKWRSIRQKVYYDRNTSRIRRIDVFHRSGALQYRVDIASIQRVGGFEVPLRVVLSSADGAEFQLDIERYWANVDLPPSVFVLSPPE